MGRHVGCLKAYDENHEVIDIDDVPDDIPSRGRYTCIGCGGELIARKGSHRMHHFAHKQADECDPWNEGMTEWHLGGQRALEQSGMTLEVPYTEPDEDGSTHRLDAFMERDDGTTVGIELQHSPMSSEVFATRTNYYLRRLDEFVWIFDVRDKSLAPDALPCRYWRDIPLGSRIRVTWAYAAAWFHGDYGPWYSRNMTVFLHVSGSDDFSDGHIVEVLGKTERGDEILGVLWDRDTWLRAMTGRGKFSSHRWHTLSYSFHDRSRKSLQLREGAPIPPPSDVPAPPHLRRSGTPVMQDGKPAPRRMPNKDIDLRVPLVPEEISVRVVQEEGRSKRILAIGHYRADAPSAEILNSLSGSVTKRWGMGLATRLEWGPLPEPLQRHNDVIVHIDHRKDTFSVTFSDDRLNVLYRRNGIIRGTTLRDVAIEAYHAISHPKEYDWPSEFLGKVEKDMRFVLRDRMSTVTLVLKAHESETRREIRCSRKMKLRELIPIAESLFQDMAEVVDYSELDSDEPVRHGDIITVRPMMRCKVVTIVDGIRGIGRFSNDIPLDGTGRLRMVPRPILGIMPDDNLQFAGWYIGHPPKLVASDASELLGDETLSQVVCPSGRLAVRCGYDLHGTICFTRDDVRKARQKWNESLSNATISEKEINQQEHVAMDECGRRWVRCRICGRVDTESEFSTYGGAGSLNIGICTDCMRRGAVNSEELPVSISEVEDDGTIRNAGAVDPNG